MQAKYPALLLTIFIILMAVCTGNAGSATTCFTGFNAPTTHLPDASQLSGTGENARTYSLSVDNNVVAYEASTEDRIHRTQYVSRARDLVHQNENRNTIFQFIKENPGSTLYDISRSLGINLGTVRYHLMILDINHLVATYHDGAKRIRYFTNNGSYNKDQMKIISLLNREPTNKLLGALIGQTGMSNAQITVESGLPYSDVNRYLKEMMAKGVVIRESIGKEKYLYRIVPNLEEQITANIRPE